MSVAVTFPDGTVRQVIGALKLERDGFVQSPLNCDPHWKYVLQSGRWVAASRHAKVRAISTADRSCWWDNIPQMRDDAEEHTARQSAA